MPKPMTSIKNNPNVPDLVPIFTGYDAEEDDDVDFGFKEVTETSGIALIQLPWTAEDFPPELPRCRRTSWLLDIRSMLVLPTTAIVSMS